MRVLDANVHRHEIDASIRAARHPGHDPARWALPLVAAADRVAGGRWRRVQLDVREAWTLWLPPHLGETCHGDTMPLAGGGGASLGEAAEWLAAHAVAYADVNASCWSRIVAARDSDWGPIVIAPFAIGDRTGPPQPDGRPLSVLDALSPPSGLIVIDGLHRALGWAFRGVAQGSAYPTGPAADLALEAFLAGD